MMTSRYVGANHDSSVWSPAANGVVIGLVYIQHMEYYQVFVRCYDGLYSNYSYIYIVVHTGTCRCCITDVHSEACLLIYYKQLLVLC
jgi:hypothetical protein